MPRPPRDDLDHAPGIAGAFARVASLAVADGADPRQVYAALNDALDPDLPPEEKTLVRTAVLTAAGATWSARRITGPHECSAPEFT